MRLVLGLATATLVLAGCGGGHPEVKPAELEKQVSASLEKQVGRAPDDVACPDPLEGEVGKKVRCTVTDGATKLGATVTVTSVDGKDVGFDVVVDRS